MFLVGSNMLTIPGVGSFGILNIVGEVSLNLICELMSSIGCISNHYLISTRFKSSVLCISVIPIDQTSCKLPFGLSTGCL